MFALPLPECQRYRQKNFQENLAVNTETGGWFVCEGGKRNPREVEAVRLPANVVRLTFPKGAFHYTGGQYVFVNIPGVTMWAPIQHLFTPTGDASVVY